MQLFEQIQTLDFPAPLPERLLLVEQRFDAPRVDDVAAATRQALEQSELLHRIPPGATVGVGAGSRGIANIALIVKTVVARLREAGLQPFVFPAMGSHGGATAEGQRMVLRELGITEESVGAEIRATMEVKQIGQLPDGPPLFQDLVSASADAVLLVGRVKPHTDFRSHIESGLAKMAVIGLGKQHGAAIMHRLGAAGFKRFLEPAARIYEANTNLAGGLAILENAYDQTAEIVGLVAPEIGGPREARLLERAKSLMASLPFPEIDVLVVRQLGKNISGTGMDTNIIGRLMIPREPETFGGPDVAVITVLDLTPETHGNATGIGLANITTARVAAKTDWAAMYTNAITSGIFGMWRVSLPITMADDRRAMQIAMRCCGREPEAARMVFIRDTLTLDRLWVSPNLRAEVEAHPRLSVVDEAPLSFDEGGVMLEPWKLEAGTEPRG
jgi:hypothetical protein